ncbi:Mov34-domain-containing protein [Neoconidiobolus thromboides FSU 785]|nr:Mov34-domain-containing protein [Neoconidiobolus thromboides FSU 785]
MSFNKNQILNLDLGGLYSGLSANINGRSNITLPPTLNVKVHPVVLFSILDNYLRRQEGQDNVIGTLLGVRSDDATTIEVRSCFPVPHSESEEQVAVDMEHHRAMYELHQKVNKNEVIVGWYATGSNLNTYSALIQDFYNSEAEPFGAIHLVMDTSLKGDNLGTKTFISKPVGIVEKVESCIFQPLPCEILLQKTERSALDMLSLAKDNGKHPLLSDTDNLIRSIRQLQSMLERVITYVQSVIDGNTPSNAAIGRYLMDTIAMVPKIDIEHFDKMFSSHVQDLLMVVYLSNITRAQLAITDSFNTLV